MNDSHTGALATAVAFLGALGAAIKLWPKNPGIAPEKREIEEMSALIKQIERRMDRIDERMNDAFELLSEAEKSLRQCLVNTTEALTRLDERRHDR